MGVAAVRHVMLDTEEDKKKPTTLLELRFISMLDLDASKPRALESLESISVSPKEPALDVLGGLRLLGSASHQVRLQCRPLTLAPVARSDQGGGGP